MTIASSTADHPITRCPDAPISTGLSPLDVWTAIKTVLRRELGEREWEMWIQHARLWREDHQCLAVQLPRKGKVIFGALRHYKRVKALARRMTFDCIMMPEMDWEYWQLKREAIEAMSVSDQSEQELWEMRGEALDRNKGPEGEPLDEFLDRFPISRRRKNEQMERWEEMNEKLSRPFLEPPCSPLWPLHGAEESR